MFKLTSKRRLMNKQGAVKHSNPTKNHSPCGIRVDTDRYGGLGPGYSASKSCVAQLTKSLSIAYADEGIRVNAVAPGWIETPVTSALQSDGDRHAAIIQRTPLQRWGTPEDIAGGVVFLASPLAKFITGTVLPIDGGYLVA